MPRNRLCVPQCDDRYLVVRSRRKNHPERTSHVRYDGTFSRQIRGVYRKLCPKHRVAHGTEKDFDWRVPRRESGSRPRIVSPKVVTLIFGVYLVAGEKVRKCRAENQTVEDQTGGRKEDKYTLNEMRNGQSLTDERMLERNKLKMAADLLFRARV